MRRDHAVVVEERDRYKHLAELLQKELERIRDEQKTPREHVDTPEIQLAFAGLATELLAKLRSDPPADSDGASAPPDKKKRNHTPHGRSILPEHLPVETILFKIPPGDGRTIIGEEVSWRLGFRPAQFYRLKIVRQIAAVPEEDADSIVAIVTLHEGDGSTLQPGAQQQATGEKDEAAAITEASGVEQAATTGEPARDEQAPSMAGATNAASAPCAGATTVESSGEHKTITRDTTVVCIAAPDEMIPRGLPTHELLAQVLIA